jgi:hypothetical protein
MFTQCNGNISTEASLSSYALRRHCQMLIVRLEIGQLFLELIGCFAHFCIKTLLGQWNKAWMRNPSAVVA